MTRKFQRRKVKQPLYSYRPQDSLRAEEISAYRKFAVTIIIILAFAAFLYFWGVQIVATLGSIWTKFAPTPSTNKTEEETFIGAPRLDLLPSAINDLSKFSVSGWANAGVDVLILINDEEAKKVLADSGGRFEVKDLQLIEGGNKISAQAVSAKGQKSQPSKAEIVVYDKTPPELTVSEPTDGAEFSGEEQSWITISGTTEPKSIVTINEHQVIVDLEGNFRFQLKLADGENLLKIVAKDEAGNETVVELTIKYLTTDGWETRART
ncbi:MAG: hypothetical protein FJ044_00810 [Candidatus Cloacimonetes bacterium]|nr:hypothetical protein [Candidatus Cloacimonadota bacterium]